MTFIQSLDEELKRHRTLLVSAVAFSLVVGFGLESAGVEPEGLAAAGIYIGSIVTLMVCGRVAHRAHPSGPTWKAVVRDYGLVVVLAWVVRILVALSLAPYQAGDPAWPAVAPLLLGWPLDLLLVAVALAMAALLRRGGMVLAAVIVIATGALGGHAAVVRDAFGPAGPILRSVRFPWQEVRNLPVDLSAGAWGGVAADVGRMATYAAVWLALAVAVRERRGRTRQVQATPEPTHPPTPPSEDPA